MGVQTVVLLNLALANGTFWYTGNVLDLHQYFCQPRVAIPRLKGGIPNLI